MVLLRKIRTLSTLSADEIGAFFEAAMLLAFARLLVRFAPLKRWRNEVEISKPVTSPSASARSEQFAAALQVRRAINRASRNSPVEYVCLPQALSARWMLSRRGVPNELFLGTKIGTEETREFHAWLKAGKMMVTGDCEESEYAVLGSKRHG